MTKELKAAKSAYKAAKSTEKYAKVQQMLARRILSSRTPKWGSVKISILSK